MREDTTNDARFAGNLTRLREEHGYNQEQLARVSGVSASSIRNYEKNRTTPHTPQLRLLAKALNVDFNELLGGYKSNRQIAEELSDILNDLRSLARERGKDG